MTLEEQLSAYLVTIADNVPKVYEAGKNAGGGGGYEKGYEDGAKAEYDKFWDNFQENGNRTDYRYAFRKPWNDAIFKPKHNLVVANANAMFDQTNITDLAGLLKAQGVTMDTSSCTTVANMFYIASGLLTVPTINVTNATALTLLFYNDTKLHTIEKIVFKANGGNTFDRAFNNCVALENITFEGTVTESFDIHWSTELTHDSLMSIIEHLGTVSSKTCTLGSANLAKLTDTEKAIATQKGWTLA